MNSAAAWSSRWAAGTAALLLAGGGALPGDDLQPTEPDVAPTVNTPVEETPEPAEGPVEEPGADDPGVPTEPPADDSATDGPPAEGPPAEAPTEDVPTEEPEPVGPVLVVVPEPVASIVDGAPGYLLPLGDGGFTWLVDGVRIDELGAAARLVESPGGSWYELSAAALGTDVERLVLAVVAAPDHALLAADGTTSLVRSVLDPRVPAELALPTALDGAGREDAVVVPDAPGQVVKDAAGEALDGGTHPVTAEYVDGAATVTLTVTAADGHRLEVGGTPVETVPGAGGATEVVLVLTDAPPAEVEPVPSPAEPPSPTEPEELATPPAQDPAQRQQLELAAPLVTVATTAPAPVAVAADAAEPAQEEVTLEELPESGPEGLGLMVMLGGLLLGGSWLVLGMRGD